MKFVSGSALSQQSNKPLAKRFAWQTPLQAGVTVWNRPCHLRGHIVSLPVGGIAFDLRCQKLVIL